MTDALLSVRGLKTWFHTFGGVVKAVDGVSFDLAPGEILGLVGESGGGKSMVGFSIMGLIYKPGRIEAGEILFGGRDLARLTEGELQKVRGKQVAMIFQDPMSSLNPRRTIGAIIAAPLKQNGLGQLLIGGGWPARIDARGRPVADPDTLAQNLAVALEVVPRIGPVQVLRTWAAYVNGTDDWRPLIGEVPGRPGFFLCYVPWLGFTGGPAAARIVASQVQGRAVEMDVDVGAFAVAA